MSTKDRRPLIEGLKPEPEVDPETALGFVYQNKPKPPEPPAKAANPTPLATGAINPVTQSPRVALTARIPVEMFQSLKRASFERQLQGVEPSSLQAIVEDALTPWLRKHGYLP